MNIRDRAADRPPAVVLCFEGTGLATVRCLAKGGMKIHAALFPSTGSGRGTRYSRHCKAITLDFLPEDEEALCRWLGGLSRSLGQRPVVFPTSDATALFLAKHRPRLESVSRSWETAHDDLHAIISKDRLYQAAAAIGINVPPMLVAPAAAEVAAWCRENRPPYFVKPFYACMPDCELKLKNRIFHSAEELLRYASTTSLHNVLVQRMIDCGDGHVYDVYGLCNRRGEVLTLGSHRRIRQYPPGTGATSYGEIPIIGAPDVASRIFDDTRRLLSRYRYHGIFGIEWLHEKGTGALYLTDFNARPFSSIGHLSDCGLNLPLLAYRELLGDEPSQVDLCPSLEPRYWLDFNCDLRSFRATMHRGGQTWRDFARSVLRCRSFAYFDVGDPGPWLYRSFDLLRLLAGHLARR